MLLLLAPLFFFAFVALPAIIAYFIDVDAKTATHFPKRNEQPGAWWK
jgi:hypothetical protein